MSDFRKAERIFEQTNDCIKATFKWPDSLIAVYTLTAGKIDLQTNGLIVKVDEKI